jgi:2-polyprenyl-6-methoxyphenol hydroxylase-like FAD-dependent oxidoreductase
VTVLEARNSLGGLFRGEALMPSGLEALEAMGLWPLPATVIQRPLQGWSFWLERRAWFAVDEPMDGGPACTLVDPCSLVQALADQLRPFPHVQLSLGCGVSGTLTGRDGRVRGVRLHDGQALAADLVVACDSRGSSLRRSAGLRLSRPQRPIDVLWFQLPEPAGSPLIAALAGRFHTVLAEGRSLALYPSARGGVQLGLPLQPGERQNRSSEDWLALWRRLCPHPLAAALQELPPGAIEGPLRLPVQVGLAGRWWRPGLLLLGDAAHPMSPVRAQGTSMGLRDAVVAADHLAGALAAGSSSAQAQAVDHALAAISWRRRNEIARIQALQRQEWQRGERLAHNRLLRQLLAGAPPWIGDRLAARWQRSQMPLRHGQAGALRQGDGI